LSASSTAVIGMSTITVSANSGALTKKTQFLLGVNSVGGACSNECSTSGVKQCSGATAYQTCGNYDADSCLELGGVILCSNGQTCSNGVCSATSSTAYTLSVTKTGVGTVTSTPSGISCGATCSKSFAGGSTITLKATTISGNIFSSWSGCSSSSGSSCYIVLNDNKSVEAVFENINQ